MKTQELDPTVNPGHEHISKHRRVSDADKIVELRAKNERLQSLLLEMVDAVKPIYNAYGTRSQKKKWKIIEAALKGGK